MDDEKRADPLSTRAYRHLRSNVYGLVAIFIALGGTGYAAIHLQKGSVRSKQIANGQVKTPDLDAGAVTSGKVARRTLNGADLGGNTIRARQLDESALFTRTKIVDPGGSPSQNGSDLIAAVGSITDSGPATPYLVQLGPGSYDLGQNTLELPADVELAGAGPGVTTVTASGDATVNPGPGDEIHDVAIQAAGAGSRALSVTSNVAVYDATISASGDSVTTVFVGGNASIQIRDSEVTASSTTAPAVTAIDVANSGTTTLDGARISATTASGSGASTAVLSHGDGGTVAIRGSTVEAGGPSGSNTVALATQRTAGITADASSISAGTASLQNNGGPTSAIRVGGSKVAGPVTTPGFGTIACVFSYSASYAPLSNTCG